MHNPEEKPLQGWKEIAVYLDRDQRTAIRWEKEEGLPIRRHRLSGRSSVYAYASEIEAWRTGRPTQAEAPPTPEPLWRRPMAWTTIAVAVAAALVIAYGPILNPSDPVAEAADGSMRTEQVWKGPEAQIYNRLSPDGKTITYLGSVDEELRLRDISTGESRLVTRSSKHDAVETSTVSPDGQKVASAWYNDEIGKYELRVTDLEGATDEFVAYRPAAEERGYVEAIGWLSNSRVLFVHAMFQDVRIAIADLEARSTKVLKTLDWQYPIESVVSRDGRWIAYAAPPDPLEPNNDILVLAADGSGERVVVEHPADDLPVGWTPDGTHLLFRSDRTSSQSLWALPFSEGKPAGPPRMLTAEFSAARSIGISPEGDLYYLKRTGFEQIFEARVDLETGRVLAAAKPIDTGFVSDSNAPAFSPDGKRLAYLSSRSLHDFTSGGAHIVVRELATGRERQIQTRTRGAGNPSWSPDSSSLLFRSRLAEGPYGAFQVNADGGETEVLFFPDIPASSNGRLKSASNFGWMQDGRSIHYREGYGGGGAHWIHDLDSGERRPLLPEGSNSWLNLSPNGSRFAITELRHQRTDHVAHVVSMFNWKTGERKELAYWPRPEGSNYSAPTSVAWSSDGKKLVVWKLLANHYPDVIKAELWVIDVETGQAKPTELAVDDLPMPLRAFSLHPDGERVAFSSGRRQYEVWKLSNFLGRLEASDD